MEEPEESSVKGLDMEEFLLMSTDDKLKSIPEALYDLVPMDKKVKLISHRHCTLHLECA